MSRLRRPAKPLIALLALAGLVVALSGCVYFKPNSLSLSQPGGIGSVRVHFELCTEPLPNCEPSEGEAPVQYLLAIAVPPGATPPQTITAAPRNGGPPIIFTLNEEVAREFEAASPSVQKLLVEEGAPPEAKQIIGGPFPPAGLRGVGYLSGPISEAPGSTLEWSVDADFGVPVAADGSPFTGPFSAGVALGIRGVAPEAPENRPVQCVKPVVGEEPPKGAAICGGTNQQAQVGTSDLRISGPSKATEVFVGGSAPVKFKLNYATTGTTIPSFALKATTSLKGGKAGVASGSSFVPAAIDPTSHRAPTATSEAKVTAPKNAKPGTYEVTLTATAPQGGTASQVAKVKVVKPKLKLGGVKLNKANGTATVTVKVPGAGTLTVSGKGIAKAKKKAKKAKKLKITVKAKGTTKAALEATGKAKVKAKFSFKPKSGITVNKSKSITLKQS
ncbi:MAG TPA: hypothetical protein VFN18_14045 [Solirubrobacterales bacterium]|nr:hypothetical protein [Solirubrobacterales bacterium]